MKNIFFILSTACALMQAQPQLAWVAHFNGQGGGYRVLTDKWGNVYNLGYAHANTDFDPGVGIKTLTPDGNTTYLTKLDPSGQLLWVRSIAGSAQCLATDQLGNIYYGATFKDTIDADPGAGVLNFISTAKYYGMYYAKLSPDGLLFWARHFEGNNSAGVAAMVVDRNGDLVSAGTFMGNLDFDPGSGSHVLGQPGYEYMSGFVSKLDKDGNFIFVRQCSATTIYSRDVDVDPSGNIYWGGSFAQDLDLDPGAGTTTITSLQFAVFISKLDQNGNFLWGGKIGGTGPDYGGCVSVDKFSNVYVAGKFEAGWVDLDPTAGSYTTEILFYEAGFITKLDSAGHFIWGKTNGIAGNDVSDIDTDQDGNIYLAGNFSQTIDFDPGPATFNQTAGMLDVYVSKLDKNGNLVWNGKIGNEANDWDAHLALNASQDIFMTGGFSKTMDFDPNPAMFTVVTGTVENPYIIKLASGLPTVGIGEKEKSGEDLLYPNPCTGILYIKDIENAEVKITNVMGTPVPFMVTEKGVDFRGSPQGVYFIEVTNGESRFIQKVISN